jgi:hypothetical protein
VSLYNCVIDSYSLLTADVNWSVISLEKKAVPVFIENKILVDCLSSTSTKFVLKSFMTVLKSFMTTRTGLDPLPISSSMNNEGCN